MEPMYHLTKEQLEAYKTWLLNKNNCIWLEDEFDEVEWLKANPCPLPRPILPAKDAEEFLKEINMHNGEMGTRNWQGKLSDLLTEFSNSKPQIKDEKMTTIGVWREGRQLGNVTLEDAKKILSPSNV